MTENWKDVIGYEGSYQVSDQGRVRSLDRVVEHPLTGLTHLKGKVLSCATTGDGYRQVGLCSGGERQQFRVNRLVLETFRGSPPPTAPNATTLTEIKRTTDWRILNG